MKTLIVLAFVVVLVLIAGEHALAHGGGLDRNGGHHGPGGYHYHGGGGGGGTLPSMPMLDMQAIAESRARYLANMQARSEARKTARAEARAAATAAAAARKSQELGVNYIFHHVRDTPYKANAFEEEGDDLWIATLTTTARARLKKELIVRIECVTDLRGFRTWIDKTGKYSTVAKYVESDGKKVRLESFQGKTLSVSIDSLSQVDIEHIQKIKDAS